MNTLQTGRSASASQSPGLAPPYANSRAVREAYLAKLAKLEYETRSGNLLPRDEVETAQFKVAWLARDNMLNIPDRSAHRLASETDPARVHRS